MASWHKRAYGVLAAIIAAAVMVSGLAAQTTTGAVSLEQYQLVGQPRKIDKVPDNASGLTYSPVTGTLFLVVNKPCLVVEIALDGTTRRIVELKGFDDTECITHVTGATFIVGEERRGNLCRVKIGKQTSSIRYDSSEVAKLFVEGDANNRGLEGLCYSPAGRRIYCVKEGDPRRLYEISGTPDRSTNPPRAKYRHPWDLQKASLGMADLSGMFFDVKTGHLLMLSHESHCVVEATVDGKEIGRLKLTKGHANLAGDVQQPEGIAMDGEGTLYICSEPNLLYVFKKKP